MTKMKNESIHLVLNCGQLGDDELVFNDEVGPLLPCGVDELKFTSEPESKFAEWKDEMEQLNLPVSMTKEEFIKNRIYADDLNDDDDKVEISY